MQSYKIIILFVAIIFVFLIFMFVSDRQTNNDPAVKQTADFIAAFRANDAQKVKSLVDDSNVVVNELDGKIISITFKKYNFGGAFAEMAEKSFTSAEMTSALYFTDKVIPVIYTANDLSSVSFDQNITFYYKKDGDTYKLLYIALKEVEDRAPTL